MRLRVSNDEPEPITVWLEPYGADYWVLPSDTLDFEVIEPETSFYFHLDYKGRDITLYLEGRYDDFRVLHNGMAVGCGFNRPDSN